MKKVLLSGAALLAMTAGAAQAEGLDLDLGGHFKGYGIYNDDDLVDSREVLWRQETEIHFTGETTLDNGLTVGVHVETDVDGNTTADADGFEVDEAYAYFSGGWGRINAGREDGAAYLLQVAAPSADSNIDGIRQFINPVNYTSLGLGVTQRVDYANDGINTVAGTGDENKLTYLSPIFSGFQAGLSYTPDTGANVTNSLGGVQTDDVAGQYGEQYEVAARYEGSFNNVGVIAGAGYTTTQLEAANVGNTLDDFKEWNVGLDLDFGPFGLGVVYTENNNGSNVNTTDDEETLVVGADYTTGPFKLGASYLNAEDNGGGAQAEIDRYTGGVVYTYGPGMSFRGSISYIDHELAGSADQDATSVLLGTQINF